MLHSLLRPAALHFRAFLDTTGESMRHECDIREEATLAAIVARGCENAKFTEP